MMRTNRRTQDVELVIPPEELWWLRGLNHHAYVQTKHWRELRDHVLLERGEHCQMCGLEGSDYKFAVHHTTYARVGEELDADLLVVCIACHNLIHFPESRAAKHWVSVVASMNGTSLIEVSWLAASLRPPEVEDDIDDVDG
jgi:hypothetical protein